VRDHGGVEPYAGDAVARLLDVLDNYDEAGADRVVDEVLDCLSLDDALTLVLMPFLREVGDRCETGLLSVTQEHFASHLVRSRIAGLAALAARAGPAEDRPTAVVACPPGERHDIAPLAFSILLRREGLPVLHLGADTPMTDLAHACVRIRPDLVVVAATRATALLGAARELRRIAARHPVAIAGAGASGHLADDIGALWLAGDVTQGARAAVDVLREPAG
jgi:MerR family transcriptional regulator, light-induced transcriptional regulator